MKTKRVFLLIVSSLLALLILFVLSACGGANSGGSYSANNNTGTSVTTQPDNPTDNQTPTDTSGDTSTGAPSNNQTNQPSQPNDAQTPTDTNSPSTISMLECEALPNVSDGNGNTITGYTMPNIPDTHSFTGTSGPAPMCVAGYQSSNGTQTVDVPSNLDRCQESSVTFFQSGSVIKAYIVPNGDDNCIAVNGS